MKTLKAIGRWLAFIIITGNLLFVNWAATNIGFSRPGDYKYALLVVLIDLVVLRYVTKFMGWWPRKYYPCDNCGHTTFNEGDGFLVCSNCGTQYNEKG